MKKFSSFLVLLLLMLASFTAGVEYHRGDVSQDGNVDIDDITCLINYLLNGTWDDEPVNPDEPQTETFTVNGVSFTMVAVEGGTFTMGATPEQSSDARDNEKPAHEVTLSSYCIGETEVTQALWQAVMGSNPSNFTGDLQRPVEQVSWNNCQAFITKLNQMTGKTFRLPTEAEWEYAARGGKLSQGFKYAGSNIIGDVAWYEVNAYDVGSSSSEYGTHVVATKAPNELGLYDMSGNVWEWCQDWYSSSYYSNSPSVNPTGPASGTYRVYRGGSWCHSASNCRVSIRNVNYPMGTNDFLGLRLAL
jgi:formylglycine-generating enzyme required for sulfatase activity